MAGLLSLTLTFIVFFSSCPKCVRIQCLCLLCQESDLSRLSKAREAELKYVREQNELKIAKDARLAEIESEKFKNMISAIGTDTIRAIAVAGPEMQVCRWLLLKRGVLSASLFMWWCGWESWITKWYLKISLAQGQLRNSGLNAQKLSPCLLQCAWLDKRAKKHFLSE